MQPLEKSNICQTVTQGAELGPGHAEALPGGSSLHQGQSLWRFGDFSPVISYTVLEDDFGKPLVSW